MNQLTSSTKPLLSFAETEITKKLSSAYGARLHLLSKAEKYQLAGVIVLFLAELAESAEGVNDGGCPDGCDDTILDLANGLLAFRLSGNVKAALFILKNEDPDNLAAIVPAIASYAHEDNRLFASKNRRRSLDEEMKSYRGKA